MQVQAPHPQVAYSFRAAALCAVTLMAALPHPAQAQSPEQQFAQLLLSSAWCSFRYNKVSGTSRQTRYQFFNNGTWRMGAQGETYSSGPNGIVGGHSNSGSGGRWAVHNGAFYLSEGAGPMEQVPIQLRQNSNGYPIIVADGTEYMQCR
jgi:hypothetical protein